MPINEVIQTGRKFRKLIEDGDTQKWVRLSTWTHSTDVEFEDKHTAEEKVGDIKGITADVTSVTVEGYAADATAVKNIRVYVGSEGMLHFVDGSGADTVIPFSKYDDGYNAGYADGYAAGLNQFSKYETQKVYGSGSNNAYTTAKVVPAEEANDLQKSVGTPCYLHENLGTDGREYTQYDPGSGKTWYRCNCAKCAKREETTISMVHARSQINKAHYSTVKPTESSKPVGYLLK